MYKNHETMKFVGPNVGIGSQTKPNLSQENFPVSICRKIRVSWWFPVWSPVLCGLHRLLVLDQCQIPAKWPPPKALHIDVSVFMPVPCCFDCYSSVVSFEIWMVIIPALLLLLRIDLLTLFFKH